MIHIAFCVKKVFKSPNLNAYTFPVSSDFHLCKNHPPLPLPAPCCEKCITPHPLFTIQISSLKILIKKTCLYYYYFHEPTDDLFCLQAKKHCVLDLSINITCLNKLC